MTFNARLLAALAIAMLPFAAAWAADEAEGDLEPIEIELPEPSYMGTPLDYWSEHLEISFKKREPFMAPKGAEIISTDAKVTASVKPEVGTLDMIVDGDKEAKDSSYVELADGVQYVQIDLGKPCEIYAIILWHYHAEERVYFDTICKVAKDADFTEDVETIYNNDYDNSAGLGVGEDKEFIENAEGRLIDAEGKVAQFIRLYSNGNTTDERNHYVEVEVWGKPVE